MRQAGTPQKALQEIDAAFAPYEGNKASLWHWRFRLLKAETLLSLNDSKRALVFLGEDPAAWLSDRVVRARWLADRGYAASQLELLNQALDLARASGDNSVAAQALLYRAIVGGDDFQQAWRDADAALSLGARARDSSLLASANGMKGYLLLRKDRYDEALPYFSEALRICRRDGYNLNAGRVLTNLGWCHFRLGDYDSAGPNFREAADLLAKGGNLEEQQKALGNLGSVMYIRQDYGAAIPMYKRALQIAEPLGSKETAFWLTNLASAYVETNDLESAERLNQRVLDSPNAEKDSALQVATLVNAAQIAEKRGRFAEAQGFFDRALTVEDVESAQLWNLHSALAEFYARKGSSEADGAYQSAINIIDTNWSALINDSSKLTFPIQVRRFYQTYVKYLMDRHHEDKALDFVEAHRARLLQEKTGAKPAPFSAIAKSRNAVLLSYWLAPEHSYLWAVAPGRPARAYRLDAESTICKAVDEYAQAIKDKAQSDAGRSLYNTLVAPAKNELMSSPNVVVVPDGCLNHLNLEALIAPDDHYWVEDSTIRIAPSLQLLYERQLGGGARDSVLLIGDPVPDPSLPPLPFASEEISAIRDLYPNAATVLKRSEATPDAYRKANPSGFPLIHFAAHSVPNSESPLDSAVVLTNGKLYARDVENIHLTNALVTISACQSAGAKTYSGEGLVGFAWAFLSAGANSVIASLWDVNDRTTAEFMQKLYTRLQKNEAPAEALRDVKLDFIRGSHRAPYFWAPFEIYTR